MFIAPLFVIARTRKHPRCPSTRQWIKMWYIYTMDYYSTVKNNDMLKFACKWMELDKKHPEWDNPDLTQDKHGIYLVIKPAYSPWSEKLCKKDNPKNNIHWSPWEGEMGKISWETCECWSRGEGMAEGKKGVQKGERREEMRKENIRKWDGWDGEGERRRPRKKISWLREPLWG